VLTLQSIVTFILVLAVLIFVHELGHFLVARWCKVKVLTFALGFGPTLFSRQWGETEYALKAVPLGGYVRMFGEEDDTDRPAVDRSRSFSNKSVWQRMAIVAAGPLFNLLTAALIFCGVFMWGVPTLTSQVGTIKEGSPAALAGLMEGDTLTSLAGHPISEWEQIRQVVQEVGGASVAVEILRDGTAQTLMLTPERTATKNIFGEEVQVWLIGITPKGTFVTTRHNPITAIALGLDRTW